MGQVYTLGLASPILDDVLVGDKRIECRLKRGKFAHFKPGDRLRLRRDIYRNGEAIIEIPDQAEVEITKIEDFASFRAMFETVNFALAVPGVISLDEAIARYAAFYTADDESAYGVTALHIKLIWPQL